MTGPKKSGAGASLSLFVLLSRSKRGHITTDRHEKKATLAADEWLRATTCVPNPRNWLIPIDIAPVRTLRSAFMVSRVGIKNMEEIVNLKKVSSDAGTASSSIFVKT
jgi:hypothetical protein